MASSGNILVFTDADVEFDDGYFDRLQLLGKWDGVCGAKLSRDLYASDYQLMLRAQTVTYRWLGIAAASGSNMVMTRPAFDAVGGFRTQLNCNEDTELFLRAGRRGLRMQFDERLVVWARDHRRLRRGWRVKAIHSLVRNVLLYFVCCQPTVAATSSTRLGLLGAHSGAGNAMKRTRRVVISTFHTALPAYAQLYGMSWIVDWAWAMLRDVHNSTAATLCPSSATLSELQQRGFQRVQLWATAMKRVRGVRVALVGDGPDRARLEQLFEGLPVTFVGLLHGADLASAYASGDVFAFPSDTETFGNVVLEAMACGLPVVATSVGGQVDLVGHEVSGLLFEPDDVGQFAAHLERYRDDTDLRGRHGAAGLLVAHDRTWRHQVELLETHYCAAMDAEVDGAVAAAA